MTNKVNVKLQGKEVEGIPIEYETIKEDWNEYKLKDGSTIKIKVIVSKIIRTDSTNDLGEPIYVVGSTNVVDSTVPDKLRVQIKKEEHN